MLLLGGLFHAASRSHFLYAHEFLHHPCQCLCQYSFPLCVQQSCRQHPESYFNHQAILATRNDIVSNLNAQLLERMPGHSVETLSTDSVVDLADASDCPTEVLNQLSEPGLPPHKLTLKEGFSQAGITIDDIGQLIGRDTELNE
ncbi:hypothetical protein V2W45_1399803 [Cenococcum geophilum]